MKYLIGKQFWCEETKCIMEITEVHSDGYYLVQPIVDHYVFKEMEYKYPAMKYRSMTVERMVSIGYWKEI